MNVLIACEESGRVTFEFLKKGHNAFSCDIMSTSGSRPDRHIKSDVLKVLNTPIDFITEDGKGHNVDHWDLIIAFPPCTHLAVSGAKHFEKKRKDGRQREAIEFFGKILNCKCERLAIENPVNIISGVYVWEHYPDLCNVYALPRKYSQIIHPYYFGDHVRKKTCLWLRGLPKLIPTEMVEPDIMIDKSGNSFSGPAFYARDEKGKILSYNDPRTGIIRSKTYPGVARAMADQWG